MRIPGVETRRRKCLSSHERRETFANVRQLVREGSDRVSQQPRHEQLYIWKWNTELGWRGFGKAGPHDRSSHSSAIGRFLPPNEQLQCPALPVFTSDRYLRSQLSADVPGAASPRLSPIFSSQILCLTCWHFLIDRWNATVRMVEEGPVVPLCVILARARLVTRNNDSSCHCSL